MSSSYADGDRGGSYGVHDVTRDETVARHGGYELGIGGEQVGLPTLQSRRSELSITHDQAARRVDSLWWEESEGFRYPQRFPGV